MPHNEKNKIGEDDEERKYSAQIDNWSISGVGCSVSCDGVFILRDQRKL